MMFKYNVSQISKFRPALMGIATILIFIVHAPDNGVMMPNALKTICALGSLGVDLFLLLSGFGLWYSLNRLFSDKLLMTWGGVKYWYSVRYKRILIPYALIVGPISVLEVLRGESVWTSILNFSTINYWLNHRGAWFIAMLIPLYAITPVHYMACNRTKSPTLYNMAIILFLVVAASIKVDFSSAVLSKLFDNMQFVAFRLPSFFIGYMLAPFAKDGKSVSLIWMVMIPLIIVATMRFLHFGYWPGFLVLPLVVFSSYILKHAGCLGYEILSFFGQISLESYLFNTTIGSVLIFLFPRIHESCLNNNGYLHYVAILIIGTLLAFSVRKFCERVIFKK